MLRAVHRRAAFLVDAQGQRFPIGARLIIGRAHEADIVIQSGRVARHHVALVRLPSGEVEAEDLATTNGTTVNEQRLRYRVLAPGDVLEVEESRYVFELGPDVAAPLEPAASLLARAADSEAARQVWIDLLLEQGDPLGARLAAGQPMPLSPLLESAVELGTLELEWRRSFVHRARLRAQAFPAVRELFFELLSSEAARFLDTLTLPELHPRFGLEGAALPALRVLRFGPFFTPEDGARCLEALARVRFPGAPLLQPPEVQQYSKAWLEFDGGQRRELEQGHQETFPSCAVRWEPGGWLVSRVRQNPTLLFNGRSRFSAVLAPGDVVSSGATRFVFRAS